MFIRRTQTRRTEDGQPYFSHRLVHSERVGNAVRQRTLLNLGRHFDIPQAQWPLLCTRIDDVLTGQTPLVADYPPAVEHEAQRIAAQLVARGAPVGGTTAEPTDVQPVDVDSLRLVRPRSVGVEQVGLWALEQLGLPALLTRLGVNGALRAAAAGAIVGRLAHPASERATHRWLQDRSGLGELLGVDFETVSAMQLYRASDALVKHREAIEAHLFDKAMGLFDLQPTVTLYDLTNTYFEGEASEQPQARRGHSKEKRSDCPLLTLGLMLDASGFVRRSKVFAGNVREHRTLAGMLEALQAPTGALVVMDRGVATDACVTWLREHGYRYLVVSRERHRQFDAEAAVAIQTQSKQTVQLHKAVSTDPDEVRLYCYSEERAEKERGIVERFATRFEAALTKLHEGLARPRAHKRLKQVWQRIGRLKAQHTRVASHYQIGVTADETALFKRYVEEDDSEAVLARIDDAPAVGTAVITRVEVAAALARAVRAQRLDRDEAQGAEREFLDDWADFTRIGVTEALVARAGNLAWHDIVVERDDGRVYTIRNESPVTECGVTAYAAEAGSPVLVIWRAFVDARTSGKWQTDPGGQGDLGAQPLHAPPCRPRAVQRLRVLVRSRSESSGCVAGDRVVYAARRSEVGQPDWTAMSIAVLFRKFRDEFGTRCLRQAIRRTP